jgi:hypothetical protein
MTELTLTAVYEEAEEGTTSDMSPNCPVLIPKERLSRKFARI